MKKIAILSALLGGFTLVAIGCTSHEAQQPPSAAPVEQSSINSAPAQDSQSPNAMTGTAPASEVQ